MVETYASHAPLFRFNEERRDLVTEVSSRVYSMHLAKSRTSKKALAYLLNETAITEIERLRLERGPEDEVRDKGWWRAMARRLSEMSEAEKRKILRELVDSYVDDTAGRFAPEVYKFATGMLPIGLGVLFKTQDLRKMPDTLLHVRTGMRKLRDLSQRVKVEGELDTLRKLSKIGTVIVVPTHSSNMDSILMGWSLESSGLPPVTYGAGKNLFTNPLTSFFMHNLGAYKVDRRLSHTLYKDVLKTYSQVLIERGFHSLFFPGGTRCRSNIVEDKLKLGLLGTAISGYVHNLKQNSPRPVFICPATINYNLVLEAESLIREHFKREGKARYFLDNDEFNQVSTVIRFVMNTVSMNASTSIRFGTPMDPFGNRVESDGKSYDSRGRCIDPASYVKSIRTGEVIEDINRDREYTAFTGSKIGESFRENTVLQPASIVAFALFEILAARYPDVDVFELLRIASHDRVNRAEFEPAVRELYIELNRRARAGEFFLSTSATTFKETLDEGLKSLEMFHVPAAIEHFGSGVIINRLELLYFYGNRVRTFVDDARPILKRAGVK